MIDWDSSSQAANASILSAFVSPVSFVIDGLVTKTQGVFTSPSDMSYAQNRRTDDYDIHGVDARRSEYELEMLEIDVPPSACEGTCVEVKNKVFKITHFDPPDNGSIVLHLHDTGELV